MESRPMVVESRPMNMPRLESDNNFGSVAVEFRQEERIIPQMTEEPHSKYYTVRKIEAPVIERRSVSVEEQ